MSILLSGAISCKAAIENNQRQCLALHVNSDKRSRDFAYIIAKAKEKKIPVRLEKKAEFQNHFPNSGGIVLEAENRKFPELNQEKKVCGFICYIDGVEDPHNLGSIVRTLYAAGCNLLILPERNWDFSEPVIMKASAGAWDRISLAVIGKDEELLEYATRYKLPIVCAARDHAVSLFDYTFKQDCLMVIGGALRGISPALLKAGEHVYIPYGRDFKNALDTPAAAAVMAFSYVRALSKPAQTE